MADKVVPEAPGNVWANRDHVAREGRSAGANGTRCAKGQRMNPFGPNTLTVESTRAAPEVRASVLTSFAAALAVFGFRVASHSEQEVVFERSYRTGLTWFLTVITFPLGLILFTTMRRTQTVVVVLRSRAADGTMMTVTGQLPRRIRRELQSIAHPGAGTQQPIAKVGGVS